MDHKNWWHNNRWCWRFRFNHANVQPNIIIPKQQKVYAFFSKDKTSNYNINIENIDNFKSFMYNKLFENTVGNDASNQPNEIYKNATLAVPSK